MHDYIYRALVDQRRHGLTATADARLMQNARTIVVREPMIIGPGMRGSGWRSRVARLGHEHRSSAGLRHSIDVEEDELAATRRPQPS
jgi:hypothetical protein